MPSVQISYVHMIPFNTNHESILTMSLSNINHCIYHIIVDSSKYALLLSNAGTRLTKAFADSSCSAYQNKLKMFLMFCIKFNIDYPHLKVADVLAFIEVLAGSNLSCSTGLWLYVGHKGHFFTGQHRYYCFVS